MILIRIISKFIPAIAFVIIICAACERDPIIRDESATYLLCKVYKPKGDYFKFVNIWGGDVAFPSTLTSEDTLKIRFTDEDTLFRYRFMLIDGYVLDLVITEDDYFTDMTIAELVSQNDLCEGCLSLKELSRRVIDKDPFLEYYVDRDTLFYYKDPTNISRLNEIIKTGELDNYLDRTR